MLRDLLAAARRRKLELYWERVAFRQRKRVLGTSSNENLRQVVRALLRPVFTVRFQPRRPGEFHVIHKLCALSGWTMTGDARSPADVVVHFHDTSLAEPHSAPEAINGRCLDIRKRTVQEVFERVFGYPLAVDPTRHAGQAVRKSDTNARHDGEVIDCPIPPDAVRDDSVYQRLVGNEAGDMVLDLRAVIHGRRIPLVYRKFRPVGTRFSNTNARAEMSRTDAVFTPEEQKKLLAFAEALHLDFGEIDVLRDHDGRIYVVDANNTPMGPPNGLPEDQEIAALRAMQASFHALVAEHLGRPVPGMAP